MEKWWREKTVATHTHTSARARLKREAKEKEGRADRERTSVTCCSRCCKRAGVAGRHAHTLADQEKKRGKNGRSRTPVPTLGRPRERASHRRRRCERRLFHGRCTMMIRYVRRHFVSPYEFFFFRSGYIYFFVCFVLIPSRSVIQRHSAAPLRRVVLAAVTRVFRYFFLQFFIF